MFTVYNVRPATLYCLLAALLVVTAYFGQINDDDDGGGDLFEQPGLKRAAPVVVQFTSQY